MKLVNEENWKSDSFTFQASACIWIFKSGQSSPSLREGARAYMPNRVYAYGHEAKQEDACPPFLYGRSELPTFEAIGGA